MVGRHPRRDRRRKAMDGTQNEAVEMAEEAVELSQQDHEPAPEADQQAFLDELGLDIDLGADPIDTPDGMP